VLNKDEYTYYNKKSGVLSLFPHGYKHMGIEDEYSPMDILLCHKHGNQWDCTLGKIMATMQARNTSAEVAPAPK
jgi:hypothetical protein